MSASKGEITELRVVVTSFFVDLLDIVMNLFIAILTGSVVMLSEFFQGLADLTAAGFLLIGHARSKKKADKIHPFGHGKEVYFWTLISAVIMMTLTATASFYFGLERLLNPREIEFIGYGYAALMIALVTNGYALSLSVRKIVEDKPLRFLPRMFLKTTIVATKNALVLDLMGTLAAGSGLLSLFLYQFTGDTRFDGIGAMVIGITTAVLAFILILGLKGLLIGERASIHLENKIRKAALLVKQVKEVLDLRTMQIGPDKLLANIEVHMQDHLNTDEIERIVDKIKRTIHKKVPSVAHVQVELETPEQNTDKNNK